MPRKARPTRGKGEGSIYPTTRTINGRTYSYYAGSVELGPCRGDHTRRDGTPCPGGERRKARVVRRTRGEVVTALDELRRDVAKGFSPDRSRTVEQYLTWYLEHVKRPVVKDSTYDGYVNVTRRITKAIGHVKLHALRKGDVETMMRSISGLSAAARKATLSLLSESLTWAVGDDILPRNVCATVKGPQVHPKIDDIPTYKEHKAILAAAEGDRLFGLWWFALSNGMRQGELLALRWDDIDLDAKALYVRKAKTRAGVRTVPLIPQAIEVLKAHKALQATEQLEAPVWHDTTGLVFTGTHYGIPGSKLDPRQLRDLWADLCKRAGVKAKPRTINGQNVMANPRFHTTRKLAGIQLRRLGVPLDIAMRILGHSNIKMTAEVYAIPDEEMLYSEMVKGFGEDEAA